MKVRAKAKGFYVRLQAVGDVFDLSEDEHFSDNWMEKVEDEKPARKAPAKKAEE